MNNYYRQRNHSERKKYLWTDRRQHITLVWSVFIWHNFHLWHNKLILVTLNLAPNQSWKLNNIELNNLIPLKRIMFLVCSTRFYNYYSTVTQSTNEFSIRVFHATKQQRIKYLHEFHSFFIFSFNSGKKQNLGQLTGTIQHPSAIHYKTKITIFWWLNVQFFIKWWKHNIRCHCHVLYLFWTEYWMFEL